MSVDEGGVGALRWQRWARLNSGGIRTGGPNEAMVLDGWGLPEAKT